MYVHESLHYKDIVFINLLKLQKQPNCDSNGSYK